MNNRISREEVAAILFFMFIFITIGAVGGYSARVISSRDRFLTATASKYFADAELSQKQIDQIIKEGSDDLKKEKKNGKSR